MRDASRSLSFIKHASENIAQNACKIKTGNKDRQRGDQIWNVRNKSINKFVEIGLHVGLLIHRCHPELRISFWKKSFGSARQPHLNRKRIESLLKPCAGMSGLTLRRVVICGRI